jgi:hypothetical protein
MRRIGVVADDGVRQVLDQAPVLALAGAQRLFDALALGDVAHERKVVALAVELEIAGLASIGKVVPFLRRCALEGHRAQAQLRPGLFPHLDRQPGSMSETVIVSSTSTS